MLRMLGWVAVFLGGVAVGASGRVGSVTATHEAPRRTSPKGNATVTMLSPADASAFVGILEMAPGAMVPAHRDDTDEFIYVLEGGGQVFLDGVAHTVKAGDLITMPGGIEVRFEGASEAPLKALQVFAPPGPASKYGAWTPTPASGL